MKLIAHHEVSHWVARELATLPPTAAIGFGIMEDGKILAAMSCHTYTEGRNIYVDTVILDRKAALPLFRAVGRYVFNQLALPRLTVQTESDNLEAIKLHQKLGCELEGTLKQAGKSGNDILISALWSTNPRWLRFNRK